MIVTKLILWIYIKLTMSAWSYQNIIECLFIEDIKISTWLKQLGLIRIRYLNKMHLMHLLKLQKEKTIFFIHYIRCWRKIYLTECLCWSFSLYLQLPDLHYYLYYPFLIKFKELFVQSVQSAYRKILYDTRHTFPNVNIELFS